MRASRALLFSPALMTFFSLPAQTPSAASTPPMGWNSWDSYAMTVDESTYLANAVVMAQKLKPFGWKYAVVDEGWFLQNPRTEPDPHAVKAMGANGLLLPDTAHFPSSHDGAGFAPLAEKIHQQGLLFGIHIIHGIPRTAVEQNLPVAATEWHAADAADTQDVCSWNKDMYGLKDNMAGQAYYDSMLRLYARWDVDYLKVDCIAQPYNAHEIEMLRRAITRSGRAIVLSLSPGSTPIEKAHHVARNAELWRISNDFWDVWRRGAQQKGDYPQSVKEMFAHEAEWFRLTGNGHWPDADMLPLGWLGPTPGLGDARNSRLTADEQRTVMTAWCIWQAPLFFGGNLTRLNDATLALLSNRAVLAVDQHALHPRPVRFTGEEAVWVSQPTGSKDRYVAIFNLGDTARTVAIPLTETGVPSNAHVAVDLWTGKTRHVDGTVSVQLAPHASVLYRIRVQ